MNTQEERDLIRSLQDQADQLQGAHVSFDEVAGRAQSVVRRRRVVAGAGVLAAAAILVPAASLMGGQAPRGSEIPPASEAPSVSPQPTPPAPTGEIRELSVDVAAGEAPRVSYLSGTTIHRPDGTTLEVPAAQYWSFATVGDTTFTLSYNEAEQQSVVTELDATGGVVETTPGVEALAVSSDRAVVAWVGQDGAVAVRTEQGPTTLGSVPRGSSAVAVVGTCVAADPCSVYFQPAGTGKPGVISRDGEVVRLSNAQSISDVSADTWLAVRTSATDDSSCHRVAPNEGGGFETCDYGIHTFSPSGAYVAADPSSYADGMGASGVVILDRDGELLAGWEWTGTEPDDQLTVVGSTWEDDDHLLAQVYGGGSWTMLRLGLDGSMEQVVEPVQDDDFNPPYLFAQQ